MKKFRELIYILILFFLIGGCVSAKTKSNTINIKEQRENLKGYAFCNCVAFALPKDSAIQNDISITAYHDISNYTQESYVLVRTVTKKFSDSIKPSVIGDHENKRGVLIDCMRFYQSNYLDSLVRTLDSKIVRY
jgi:PBP1b-binding outer membrane lipoprotein LpoB